MTEAIDSAGPLAVRGTWPAWPYGAFRFIVADDEIMRESRGVIRQRVSLPSRVARRVQAIAKRRPASANRVLVDLIETGLEAREREKRAFFELADRLTHSTDAAEQRRLKEELAQMTFGD